jgi:uncharacterized membrane protein
MFRTVLNYMSFQNDIQFLVYKQEYLDNLIWKSAFYVHVFSAVLALFAGFTQFSTHFLRQHRNLHKKLGRFYAWNILFINVPSAMIMAIYANGGYLGKSAFLILDILWFWFTYQAILSVKAGNFKAHKDFMIRSYALTFSAITLRSWKIILAQTKIVDPVNIYVVEAWMGFLPNLIVAEFLIFYLTVKRNSSGRNQRDTNHQKTKNKDQNRYGNLKP